MFCPHCSKEIPDNANYCSACGARVAPTIPHRRLMRSGSDSKIAGICGGIAEYVGVDSTVVRLIWVALSVIPGALLGGVLAYLFAWMIIPKAPVPEATQATAPAGQAAKT